jgi:hypothetical protein
LLIYFLKLSFYKRQFPTNHHSNKDNCWSLTDLLTRTREIRGLIKACEYCQAKEGWIITADEEEEMELEGIHIVVKAAWRWMISK